MLSCTPLLICLLEIPVDTDCLTAWPPACTSGANLNDHVNMSETEWKLDCPPARLPAWTSGSPIPEQVRSWMDAPPLLYECCLTADIQDSPGRFFTDWTSKGSWALEGSWASRILPGDSTRPSDYSLGSSLESDSRFASFLPSVYFSWPAIARGLGLSSCFLFELNQY